MTMSVREAELTDALVRVRARVAAAAEAAGRDRSEIEFLPVTKFFPPSDVIALYRLGCNAFGESREQEAARKVADVESVLNDNTIRWHMIGRIQRNKARAVAGWAWAAHSVDSAPLISALGRGAVDALEHGRRSEPLRVFIQVSLDGDQARGGVWVERPAEVDALCAAAHREPGLELAGLMAIPPAAAEPEQSFGRLQAELVRIQGQYQQPLGMSAGMSDDLETAVRYGSTCVRVGTALMGPRPLTSP
jgi:pyridoxal phosphate enzyme (YggS family)